MTKLNTKLIHFLLDHKTVTFGFISSTRQKFTGMFNTPLQDVIWNFGWLGPNQR